MSNQALSKVFGKITAKLLPLKNGKKLLNQCGYEPLNLENVSFLNSDNLDATDLRF